MLFSSFAYVFLFLPIVVLGFDFLCARGAPRAAQCWIIAASIYFYAYGDVRGVPYLLASALVNFELGRRVFAAKGAARRTLFRAGLVLNLGQLLLVKYWVFFFGAITLAALRPKNLEVPLGISFFTLAQLMYLTDCYEDVAPPDDLLGHLLFTCFFPIVSMGPISRARDLQPLLRRENVRRARPELVARGLELFFIGLLKKAIFAQSFAALSDAGWGLKRQLTVSEAWLTAVAFTFELYFDFSGYSDMAQGSALLLGIDVPQNFDSPYKSTSIIVFWRRWHITLSRFITNYIYTPLLRSRERPDFTWAMLMTVVAMMLAGLWHGAAWTFVAFGTCHGVALVINNVWRKVKLGFPKPLGWALTFSFLIATLLMFRAENLHGAWRMLCAMLDPRRGFGVEREIFFDSAPALIRVAFAVLGVVLCFAAPNSNALSKSFVPSTRRAVMLGLATSIAIVFMNSSVAKEFIYRDF